MDWINIVVSILAGLATAIPLVVKLIEYVTISIKGQKWNDLVKLVMSYMSEAERRFTDGATKKEWVLSMIKSSADSIDYVLDDAAFAKISDLIDAICETAKIVNTKG